MITLPRKLYSVILVSVWRKKEMDALTEFGMFSIDSGYF